LQSSPRGVAKAFFDLGSKDHWWAQRYTEQSPEREEGTEGPQVKLPEKKRQ